jgi:hypothetical protein
MLYLAELLVQDPNMRFGYTDDINLYHATKSLDNNVRLLASDVRSILACGIANKVTFALEKLEMIHLTKKSNSYALLCVVNRDLTIDPITTAPGTGE